MDYGCGWGELLVRMLERWPRATAVGLDIHAPDIERARTSAAARGVGGRARFEEAEASSHTERADVVVNVGSYQAFGGVAEALTELRNRLEPGGRALFGLE